MVKYFDLMFTSEESRQLWDRDINNNETTLKDTNILLIFKELQQLDEEFPTCYLRHPCMSQSEAEYRLDIMQELFTSTVLNGEIAGLIKAISGIEQKFKFYKGVVQENQKGYIFLNLLLLYINIVAKVKEQFKSCTSEGLKAFSEYCCHLAEQYCFSTLHDELLHLYKKLKNMTGISLSFNIQSKKVYVNDPVKESDTVYLEKTCSELFGLKLESQFSIYNDSEPFTPLEMRVLKARENGHSELLKELENFYCKYKGLEKDICHFTSLKQQLIFYITFVKLCTRLQASGVHISRPVFSTSFEAYDCCDLSLVINKMKSSNMEIVFNDIHMNKGDIFILSGPNQGGKTVYLRSIGIIAYLAKCGCLVGSRSCYLPFYDMIFTHFIQKEKLGKGRLIDEVERMETTKESLTENSLVLLNESFSSTRREDSLDISLHYIDLLYKKRSTVGFVTHFYEIGSLFHDGVNDLKILTAGIESSHKRTYRIRQSTAHAIAYARDIALSCGVTYDQLSDYIGEKVGIVL